jgi:hypothetical protein
MYLFICGMHWLIYNAKSTKQHKETINAPYEKRRKTTLKNC